MTVPRLRSPAVAKGALARPVCELWAASRAPAFAPFVARLAMELRLAGWVKNTPEGVIIQVEGPGNRLAWFRERLEREHPIAAEIHEIHAEKHLPEGHARFSIEENSESRI